MAGDRPATRHYIATEREPRRDIATERKRGAVSGECERHRTESRERNCERGYRAV